MLTQSKTRSSAELRSRVRLALGIARGLQYLHKMRALHLDLKPQNVLMFGDDDELKLCGFGISHFAEHTKTCQAALPMKVKRNDLQRNYFVIAATDVYGLGGVLHAMIAAPHSPDRCSSVRETLKLYEGCCDSVPTSVLRPLAGYRIEHLSSAVATSAMSRVWGSMLRTKRLMSDEQLAVKRAYHGGQSPSAARSSGEHGFMRSSPLNARFFGHGIYVTNNAEDTCRYACPAEAGPGAVVVCRACVPSTNFVSRFRVPSIVHRREPYVYCDGPSLLEAVNRDEYSSQELKLDCQTVRMTEAPPGSPTQATEPHPNRVKSMSRSVVQYLRRFKRAISARLAFLNAKQGWKERLGVDETTLGE